MAIVLSQAEYWALFSETTATELESVPMEIVQSYPQALGCGSVHQIYLREGLELAIMDYQPQDQIVLNSPEREHPLEYSFLLSGQLKDKSCALGSGQYALYGSGIGAVLLWFGWGWVKKSVQRQARSQRASWIADDPLTAEGITLDTQPQGFSKLNFLIMTKSAALETLEVAVVVITLGLASSAWVEALGATVLALLGSIVLVAVLHRYLRNLPDVLIKLGAGILLCTLGTFWFGEGWRWEWWWGDWAIGAIAALYSLLATVFIYTLSARESTAKATRVS